MASGSSPSSGSFGAPTPRVTQTWYAGDAGAGGKLQHILEHFKDLQAQGPARGYYQEPTKSILVVAPGNVAWAEEHFRGMGIRVVTGHRYLGGYIRDREAEGSWLAEKSKGGRSLWRSSLGSPESTRSLLTQDCRSHSNRSGHSCSR